jgi:outer membrane protein assembly factor BamB
VLGLARGAGYAGAVIHRTDPWGRGLVLAAVVFGGLSAQAPTWPDYRGPRHDGHSPATGLPPTWSEQRHVAWKTAIPGRAWSSPVIADGEVWLSTATAKGDRLSVLCIDLDDGKVLFDELLFEVEKPQFAHAFNTYASPSPCIDGGVVYVSFGSPGTAGLDRKTRKVLWRRDDLVCDHFRGAGSSPLVFEDLLILTMDGADRQYLIALDKRTGKTRWQTDRSTDFGDIDPKTGKPKMDGDFRKSYATPIVIRVGGEPQLISPGAKAAFAYDPRTGKEIWMVRHGNHSSASRTVFGHGLVFLNTGYSRPVLMAVDPTGKGDVTKTHVKWQATRRVPKKPSPLLIGDHLYLVSDIGVASCLDARTGESVWHERIGGEYSASLLYADGRVFAFSQAGRTVAWRPGPKFQSAGTMQLDGGFMASPAAIPGALVVRSKTHLYRLQAGVDRR